MSPTPLTRLIDIDFDALCIDSNPMLDPVRGDTLPDNACHQPPSNRAANDAAQAELLQELDTIIAAAG